MAQWNGTSPISTDTLNSGNQYTTDSQLSVQALNSIIESGLFAQNFVKNLGVAVTESIGTPSVSLQPQTGNSNYKTISFSGLKGVGIGAVTPLFCSSSSNTTAPNDNQFSSTGGSLSATNKYLWFRLKIDYTNSTTAYTDKKVIGAYGDKGEKGDTGNTGVGIQSITITES